MGGAGAALPGNAEPSSVQHQNSGIWFRVNPNLRSTSSTQSCQLEDGGNSASHRAYIGIR